MPIYGKQESQLFCCILLYAPAMSMLSSPGLLIMVSASRSVAAMTSVLLQNEAQNREEFGKQKIGATK